MGSKIKKNTQTKKWEIVFFKREKNSSFLSKVKDFLIGAKRSRDKAAEHLTNLGLTYELTLIKDPKTGKITNQNLDKYINEVIKKAGPTKQLNNNDAIKSTFDGIIIGNKHSESESIKIIDIITSSNNKYVVKDLIETFYKDENRGLNFINYSQFQIEQAIYFINNKTTAATKQEIATGLMTLKDIHYNTINNNSPSGIRYYKQESIAYLNSLINNVPDLYNNNTDKDKFEKKCKAKNILK